MRWVIVFILLAIATPTWAAKKKNKTAQPVSEPQQSQQVEETQPSESDQWNQKLCPNGIEDWKALTTMNPFDSKGRCFNYQGGLVQMLDKSKGLFSFVSSREPFAMVDFGKDSVPRNYWYGVVIGKGAYSYQTVRGDLNNIFSFASVPKSKARAAWEKSKQIEKAKEEERKVAEQRAQVEQDWMKKVETSNNPELVASPLILKDPATGLMWARNGNIAEKKMDWKEAMDWAKSLNYAGYSDWRLPTKNEYEKFLKIKGRGKSKLSDHFVHKWFNNNGFFNVQESGYWSSSDYEGRGGSYWFFDMTWSEMQTVNSNHYYALVVRDGNKPPQQEQQSVSWNQSACPKNIESMQTLFTLNPYDSKGRCFNYSGRLVQLLNKNQALFSVLTGSTAFSLIDFGKESVPMNFYSGVVQGKGAYSYETVDGSYNIILSFVPVPKSKAREEWEIAQEKEKKLNEEEASAAQAKLKEYWEKNPTYTDPSTGLMWTTSGGMGEPDRYMKDKSPMFWYDADKWIKKFNYAGYNDWRLPTKGELVAFAKRGGHFPSEWFNANGFHSVEASNYWTSSPYRDGEDVYGNFGRTGMAVVDMFDGTLNNHGQNVSAYVWPVRDTKEGERKNQPNEKQRLDAPHKTEIDL